MPKIKNGIISEEEKKAKEQRRNERKQLAEKKRQEEEVLQKKSEERRSRLAEAIKTPIIEASYGETSTGIDAGFIADHESIIYSLKTYSYERIRRGSTILINTKAEPQERDTCILLHNGRYVVATLKSKAAHVYSNNDMDCNEDDINIKDVNNEKYIGLLVLAMRSRKTEEVHVEEQETT